MQQMLNLFSTAGQIKEIRVDIHHKLLRLLFVDPPRPNAPSKLLVITEAAVLSTCLIAGVSKKLFSFAVCFADLVC
jgi:hypothetical protein